MHATATRALLLACATVGCYPEPTSNDDSQGTAQLHEPWVPPFARAGSAAGDGAVGGATANAAAGSSAAGTPPASNAGASAAGASSSEPVGCTAGRFVLVGQITNARDLGGTPLHPDGTMSCGDVYRGPPLALSGDGCAAAAKLGIRTLIDLRTESERTSTPDAACVDAKRVFAPLPVPYGLGPTDYLNDLHETASIALVFHTFGDPAAYPIYFHCTFGRDRTGIVGALLLLTLGATRSAVMQEYMLSQPNVGAYPTALNAVLDEVEQRGGAEAVLKSMGITDAELAVMRAHVLAIE